MNLICQFKIAKSHKYPMDLISQFKILLMTIALQASNGNKNKKKKRRKIYNNNKNK